MADSDKVFSGFIPKLYDTYLVPMIFAAYAEDLADRVVAFSPKNVLETAAGSGVVTRVLAARLDPAARYVVTDLNQPMLDYAASRQGHDDRINWQQADALNLPFEDASFDVVVCQFGVMFFPDRIAGYAEAKRVLKPGGQFLFSVWDHIGVNEFADIVNQTAALIFPEDPPQFLPRTPYGYYDVGTIRDELTSAGFADVSFSTLAETSPAPSPRHVAVAFCEGTPLRSEIEARDANLLDHVTERATQAIAERCGNGTIAAKIQAHVLAAVA
ncbi:MAG: methyltransferase domain-containing protein [Alphaproteobacteria bacterium]|nr:methyltransferase domain-containing protein [Alphaproteobacteria bacterium]MCZ6837935.1 methyltransferase domain-containing protein [Alphaproteobacteria bacterium]